MAKCMIDGYVDNHCSKNNVRCQNSKDWVAVPLGWSDDLDCYARGWQQWNGANYSVLTDEQKRQYDDAEQKYLTELDRVQEQYKAWEIRKVTRQGGLIETSQEKFSDICLVN